ncbi:monocarboxylate transporter 9-like [Vespa crabro]|uniref:monocarboxylate transporter 9-like n=1 Tax=Vespa crabro TaxID=7445 RepID=UPI001F002673|nr:monocarboxylate transporter 9-like [Vespa crabro]XP_046820239.1 monocarboxylate transporter 9-like [Vespa crabro]XP_046820240.1 monocarboxylate transporter 9-like [Vespa crabro]
MTRCEADRGWAWMIVLGVTIINLSVLPIQQCYGLIFGKRFTSLGISATQTSLILHLNGTICCSLGLISGPMMKKFSCRKVAFFGSFTIVIGISTTAFALSLPTIIVGYCVIIGIGQGIIYPASSLALNTYFRKKRNIAMGLCVTLTGLGPILMPLLIVKLLDAYATTGTLIIFAGIAANSFVGACLLRPFVNNDGLNKKIKTEDYNVNNEATLANENESDVEKYVVECQLLNDQEQIKKQESLEKIFKETKTKTKRSFFQKISTNLDLILLQDLRYIFVVIGMGMSLVAETNFNALIPFVLEKVSGLKIKEIATIMSIQAAFDIAGRLCVPLIAQKAHWTPRNLYVISLIGSTFGRMILCTWGDDYVVVILVAVIVGIAKGTKAVFQTLIIPDYVPLERLPAASGIQMVCNGILSIILGPIIGMVHDLTGSYIGSLHFTSAMSMFCVFLWLLGGLWSPFGKHVKVKNNGNTPNERCLAENQNESQDIR